MAQMTDDEVRQAAERFLRVLVDAKEPELHAHPANEKLVKEMHTIMVGSIPVRLVISDFVQQDRIYALDAAFFNKPPPWELDFLPQCESPVVSFGHVEQPGDQSD